MRAYGFLPQFAARLQIRVSLDSLTKGELRRILTEPANAVVPHYHRIFKAFGLSLNFTEDALDYIAQRAYDLNSGARSLQTTCEEVLAEPLFSMPGTAAKELTVDRAYIEAAIKAAK